MTDDDDTSLLRTRSDVPPDVLRALRALKAEGPTRSSLDQVAARLAAELAAPPSLPPSASWLVRAVGPRVVAFRVGLAVLAVGATAVWLRPNARQREPAHATPGAVEATRDALALSEQTPAAEPAQPASATTQRAAPEAVLPRTSDSDSDSNRSHALREPTGSRTGRVRASAAVRAASTAAPSTTRRASTERARSTSSGSLGTPASAAPTDPDTQKPDAALPRAVEPAAEPSAARERSEVELVLEARRLAARAPEAAQRLLEQHALRFPNGTLAPEREVLAIEVLKALGQTAAAEQRLRAFHTRYPNSVHALRLSTPSRPDR